MMITNDEILEAYREATGEASWNWVDIGWGVYVSMSDAPVAEWTWHIDWDGVEMDYAEMERRRKMTERPIVYIAAPYRASTVDGIFSNIMQVIRWRAQTSDQCCEEDPK